MGQQIITVEGAVTLGILYGRLERLTVFIAAFFTGVAFCLSCSLPFFFLSNRVGFQFTEVHGWISSFSIQYKLGLDGINIWFPSLVLLLGFLGILAGYYISKVTDRGFYIAYLLLLSCAVCIFTATDLFLFLFAWGFSLAPLYHLISRSIKHQQARVMMKFLVHHLLSTAVLAIAFFAIYFSYYRMTGISSFDINVLSQSVIPMHIQKWLFWALFIGFAIKLPLFPFHGWLADLVSELPYSLNIFILGISLNFGAYGLIRFCVLLCPDATIEYSQFIVYFALTTIIYGALISIAQPEYAKVVSYLCLSNMGFIVLGIFTLNQSGLRGAILHQLTHSISVSFLMIFTSWISDNYGSRVVMDFGGLGKHSPLMAGLFLLSCLTYSAVPGLANFSSLFLILGGITVSQLVWTAVALIGYILIAASAIWLYHRLFMGEETKLVERTEVESTTRYRILSLPLVIIVFWIGFNPQFFLVPMDKAVNQLEVTIQSHRIFRSSSMESQRSPASPIHLPKYQKGSR